MSIYTHTSIHTSTYTHLLYVYNTKKLKKKLFERFNH